MNYGYSHIPVQTLETLHSVAREYLHKPGARQSGPSRTAFKPILPTPQRTSLFVVRVSDREITNARQTVSNGYRIYNTSCNYYTVVRTNYRVAELTWSNGEVRELSQHATRTEADAALKAENASR